MRRPFFQIKKMKRATVSTISESQEWLVWCKKQLPCALRRPVEGMRAAVEGGRVERQRRVEATANVHVDKHPTYYQTFVTIQFSSLKLLE